MPVPSTKSNAIRIIRERKPRTKQFLLLFPKYLAAIDRRGLCGWRERKDVEAALSGDSFRLLFST